MSSIVTPAATRSEQRYNNTTAQPNPAHVHISASLFTSGPLAQQSEHCPEPSYRTCPSVKSTYRAQNTNFVQMPSVSIFCYNADLRIRNFSSNTHFCLLLAACSSSTLPIVLHSSFPTPLSLASNRRLLEGREGRERVQ